MGISLRRLHGWSPAQAVDYVREGNRIVGQTVYTEPEFNEEETDWLLAFQAYNAALNAAGFPITEATDLRADPTRYDGGYRYVATDPVTDWAEKARLDAVEAYRKAQGEQGNMNGLIFPVKRIDYTPVDPGVSFEGL